MKSILASIFILTAFVLTFGQNEQAPIIEKDLDYKDWVYKNVQTGADMNLRKFTFGKKLIMVAYFAPWCHNWKHDAPFVQSMYQKYKDKGFDVIAVGEYDPVDVIKSHVDQFKLSFPVVWESNSRAAKQTTSHYAYRRFTGDTRNWGSPWYIFLEVDRLSPEGLVLTKRAPVVNGELIRPDAEKFIREKLGIGEAAGSIARSGEIEICEPEKKPVTTLVRPEEKP